MRNILSSLRRVVRLEPDRPAILGPGPVVTYGQFQERVLRGAQALAGLGIEGGDRVAVLMANCSEYLELYYATAAMGAVGVGIARRAFEMATDYANQRRAFGQKIIDHQGVGFLLADMFIQIEAARLLCWQAAWRLDRGLAANVHAAAAKCFAADVAMRVTTDAVQVFGGYGYMEDYGVEKLMRDAKVVQIYEGTTQIQRLIIARSLKR